MVFIRAQAVSLTLGTMLALQPDIERQLFCVRAGCCGPEGRVGCRL